MVLEKLKNKKIVIYGTGYVAHKFYKAVCERGLQEQVLYFVRSGVTDVGEEFEGVPVYRFADMRIENDVLICLAVHESIKDEIEMTVQKRTSEYLWIYPYLYELMFGIPEKQRVKLCVGRLLDKFQSNLRLGVRLAVIEQQEEKNDWGFDFYIKAQMLHCDEATAKRRLKQFRKLIFDWNTSGYKKESSLSLNRNYEVFDGIHRLSMAIYMKQKYIYGDIYPTDLSAEENNGREAMMLEEVMFARGFSIDEIKRIKEVQERYFIEYKIK